MLQVYGTTYQIILNRKNPNLARTTAPRNMVLTCISEFVAMLINYVNSITEVQNANVLFTLFEFMQTATGRHDECASTNQLPKNG